MSMKRKKAGLVIGWRKSFSILAPWRKGKGEGDAVTGGDVVLTKMKLFNNFNERSLKADDSVSTIYMVSDNCRHTIDTLKVSEVIPEDESSQSQMKSSSENLSVIFSNSELPRLYKFESEDSGVELNSGANSPSTPTSSEKSFVVHSREPSSDSCNLNSDHTSPPNTFVINVQSSEIKETVENNLKAREDVERNVLIYRDEDASPSEETELLKSKDEERDSTSGTIPVVLSETEETRDLTDTGCPTDIRLVQEPFVRLQDARRSSEKEPLSMRRCNTTDSLKEYMEECCRLSETQQQNPGAVLSGLSYLQHICHLIESIGKLQETNLKLQKRICSLQTDHRTSKTKEDFFQEHCSCGAASLAYQEIQKTTSRSEILSPTGALSDLSTIPEVIRHPLKSTRTGRSNECVSVPRWKRSLNRRSYTEGGAHFLSDSREQVSTPQRRLSENYTWGRVKDIVRRAKVGNQNPVQARSEPSRTSWQEQELHDCFGPSRQIGLGLAAVNVQIPEVQKQRDSRPERKV
ncbi:hypothetical protein OJAV_G00020210 [Oryzias javanicus]|uniref:DUF4657 domain-containing protein n=1 Tax=Oryzias javanicus TaxID=123683 RepID=A0A437DGS9_ORYJA|nr:hypothetical protein OJAV_G00020210 [Oryzias javanicus]